MEFDSEQAIVGEVGRAVGVAPIILIGSRATGEAAPESDYDVLVVLPLRRIPFAIRPLAEASRRLESAVGAPVVLNSMPMFRLRRMGSTLLPWKARAEGKVLSAPPGFVLEPAGKPDLSERAVSSYALSGLQFLLNGIQPGDLAGDSLPSGPAHNLRKALLHAVQIDLLGRGSYAPTLEEALSLLGDDQRDSFSRLAGETSRADTWFAVRDRLLASVSERGPSLAHTILTNAQYVTLTWLRRKSFRPGSLVDPRGMGERMTGSLVLLALALTRDGPDEGATLRAADCLPPSIRPSNPSDWSAVHDVVEREWPQALPLLGV